MKNILLIILFICSSSIIKAQDTLSTRSGESIIAKVLEVTTNEVKYKKFDNLNGPDIIILKSDLLQIRYENGTKDDFNNIIKKEDTNNAAIDEAVQGKNDAQKFYNGYKTAGTIAFVSNFTPMLPIIPSLIFSLASTSSSNIPKDINLNYPSASLMKNEKYANSYRQEAMKIKKRKIWLNAGLGAGIIIIPLLILLSSGDGILP
jgi:hypothetical protein